VRSSSTKVIPASVLSSRSISPASLINLKQNHRANKIVDFILKHGSNLCMSDNQSDNSILVNKLRISLTYGPLRPIFRSIS